MYKIVRHYSRMPRLGEGGHLITKRRTIDTRMSLEEAQAHCQDPETSSKTCNVGKAHRVGGGLWDWFDGYEET